MHFFKLQKNLALSFKDKLHFVEGRQFCSFTVISHLRMSGYDSCKSSQCSTVVLTLL